ncbi:Gibberellin 3-beta-dioxygenase [Bertholletia excelsa]
MSALSEAYRDNPIPLRHIIPLDFRSLGSVPDSHTWPQTNSGVSRSWDPLGGHQTIPIVDLASPDAAELVGHACELWGMFQVTNHGLPLSLLEDAEAEARRLFSLPARQKMRALRSPAGTTGYGAARIAPFFSKFMWHEGFTIMGSSVDHARALWPHDYKRFCDTMDDYQKHMRSLANRLFLIILKSLNISEEEAVSQAATVHGSGSSALQLNSYPSCPDPTRAIGLAPHTDSLLLTILHQSRTTGLQFFKEGFGWVPVSPVPGALTVNVGDLLHILSNGLFPSVYHRAVVNRVSHRISAAYFYGLPADSTVGPLGGAPFPCYRSLKVKEYVSIKAKHLNRALSMIRI